jgi:acyl-CoA reductase-like NAD-dependent aldehyde dehydrogenase
VTLVVLNPATEEPIAELEQGWVEEADEAVARANEAYPAWRALPPQERARQLRRLAGLVEEHGEELARIESENVGEPISGACGEVGMVAQVLHFYAGDKHHGQTIPAAGGVTACRSGPWSSGGFTQSGFGRELGLQGLTGRSEVKSVFVSTEG